MRKLAGMSQRELAERLSRSVSWVSKVESGRRRLTDLTVIGEVAAVFGVPVSALTDSEERAATAAAQLDELPAEEMQRLAFLHGLGVLSLDPGRLRRADQPRRVDAGLVDALTEGTVALERLYGRVAPAALQGLVSGHLDAITALLRGPAGRHRRELLSLAGETATLAGWIAVDRGNDDRALSHFDGALRAAAEAGDTALGVYALGSATTVPTFRERSPRRVVDAFEKGARGVARSAATPSTAAWVATLEASAYVKLGDRDGALHALARAENVLGPDDPETARPRVTFFDAARLSGEQGIIRLRLGHARSRPDVTARYLQSALVDLPPNEKIRARFLTALATIHADLGDVAGAVNYARDAYRVGVETATLRSIDQVRRFRAERLGQWSTHPAVVLLDEEMQGTPVT